MSSKKEVNPPKPDPNEKSTNDNRSIQLNPNNETYWKDRGLEKPPLSVVEPKIISDK